MGRAVEFDHIASNYDATRRPPSEEELATLSELLGSSRSVLDAGVGTGRFAAPLRDRKFDLLGVDLSVGMMRRARAKGIERLVRADLLHLPIRDGGVDAALLAHVLQLLPDPRPALRELGRVARGTVIVLLPEWSERSPTGPWAGLRERYRELAQELGYPLAPRARRYWHSLDEISAIARPALVRVARGPAGALTLEEWFARWGTRMADQGQLPSEIHTRIVQRIQAEHPIDSSRLGRSKVERFIVWDSATLRAVPDEPEAVASSTDAPRAG
jgi:ubiquinone/menaquinone biosynthesis C-methylase UbiE